MESTVKVPPSVRLGSIIHNSFSAWLILLLSIVLTVGAYILTDHFVKKRAQDQFNFRVQEIQQAVTYRLFLYEQVLWSGAALMNASSEVTRADFRHFVDTLHIAERWPGIQGIGYAVVVPPGQLQSHIASIRAEGFPDYTVKPAGQRDQYTAIVYLEPFDWRNQRAFGYDMYSNPVRRAAMDRARDTGKAAISGLITLVQETKEDVQRGFLIYVPIYSGKTIPNTVAARRSSLRGWIYAPFRAGDLMHGILRQQEDQIYLRLYDGLDATSNHLLYASPGATLAEDIPASSRFHRRVQLNLQDRPWLLDLSASDHQYYSADSNQPRYVAITGIIVDLLLFYVIFSLKFVNRRAEAIARARTEELEQARQALESQVNARTAELRAARDNLEQTVQQRTQELQEKLAEVETLNRVTLGREERVIALKQEVNELSRRLGRELPYESVRQ